MERRVKLGACEQGRRSLGLAISFGHVCHGKFEYESVCNDSSELLIRSIIPKPRKSSQKCFIRPHQPKVIVDATQKLQLVACSDTLSEQRWMVQIINSIDLIVQVRKYTQLYESKTHHVILSLL